MLRRATIELGHVFTDGVVLTVGLSMQGIVDLIAIRTGDAVPASHFSFRAATSTYPSGRRSRLRTLNRKFSHWRSWKTRTYGIWEKSRSYADSIARDTDSEEGKQNAGGSCRS